MQASTSSIKIFSDCRAKVTLNFSHSSSCFEQRCLSSLMPLSSASCAISAPLADSDDIEFSQSGLTSMRGKSSPESLVCCVMIALSSSMHPRTIPRVAVFSSIILATSAPSPSNTANALRCGAFCPPAACNDLCDRAAPVIPTPRHGGGIIELSLSKTDSMFDSSFIEKAFISMTETISAITFSHSYRA